MSSPRKHQQVLNGEFLHSRGIWKKAVVEEQKTNAHQKQQGIEDAAQAIQQDQPPRKKVNVIELRNLLESVVSFNTFFNKLQRSPSTPILRETDNTTKVSLPRSASECRK